MAEFLAGKELDNKLTDIIWEAKKEIIIVSPFIWLDDHCKDIFKKFKNSPEVEIIIVFGKNEGYAQKSLKPHDLEIFKDFSNIVIVYCKDLHAKYYANENEALLTSLNLLGKSMVGNEEYGIVFPKSTINGKLYDDSMHYTCNLIINNPCVFVKRPRYKKQLLGLSKKYLDSEILLDATDALYNNRSFERKFYNDFELMIDADSEMKPQRNNTDDKVLGLSKSAKSTKILRTPTYDAVKQNQIGYCIRTGVQIDFNPQKPFCLNAYRSWAQFENYNYSENYCHRTGRESGGRTSMANPIL